MNRVQFPIFIVTVDVAVDVDEKAQLLAETFEEKAECEGFSNLVGFCSWRAQTCSRQAARFCFV